VQWVLGIGAPLATAGIWGLFMSPKATRRMHDPVRLITEIAIFGIAAAALADAEQPALAIALAAAVAVRLILTFPRTARPDASAGRRRSAQRRVTGLRIAGRSESRARRWRDARSSSAAALRSAAGWLSLAPGKQYGGSPIGEEQVRWWHLVMVLLSPLGGGSRSGPVAASCTGHST
jgi:Protein of unknown function (DUF2568)